MRNEKCGIKRRNNSVIATQKKKNPLDFKNQTDFLFCFKQKLFLAYCSNGALSFASSAVDALVCVNFVVICTFADCAYGALSLAASAFNALIADDSRHSCTLLYFLLAIILA